VVLLKAQAEAEALKLINAILEKNKDLMTFRYIDKLAPGIRVMLVPNDNPFLLPLPDLGIDELGLETATPGLGLPIPGETDEPGESLLPTPSPTPTPTLSP
jgi:hypothetical protein